MSRISDLITRVTFRATLKWRLLGGFLLCAALTALSGGAGILSLWQIQGTMEATTTNIGANIDTQNTQTHHLMALRSLVAFIANAREEETLADADKKLQAFRDTGGVKAGEQHNKMLKTVEQLLTHKRNQIDSLNKLSTLRKSSIATLAEVTGLAMNTVDDVEFDSTIRIDDTTTESRRHFDKMFVTTDEAVAAIKAALFIRVYCSELYSRTEDALLATDVALVDYAQTEVATLVGNIKNEIPKLTRHKTTVKLGEKIDTLVGIVGKMFKVKKKMLYAGEDPEDTLARDLAVLQKKGHAAFQEVATFVAGIADTVEFDSMIKIENAATEIKTSFNKMSFATDNAVYSIKAALLTRAYCDELNSKVKGALLATDVALVEYAQTEVVTLVDNIRNEILGLPNHETREKVGQTIDRLAGLVDKMFEAKKQMLIAENELNETSAGILEHMRQFDNSMLVAAKGTKSNADMTLQTSTRLVDRWHSFQILLVVGAVILALIVGIFVSKSIAMPLGEIAEVARNVAIGKLTHKEIRTADDEIGQVSTSFVKVVESLREIASVCQAIAEGNFDESVEIRSEDDALGKAVNQMGRDLKEMSDESLKKISYLNNVPTTLHVIDKDFNVQFINKAGASLVKSTVDECMGRKCYDLFNTKHCRTEKCLGAMAMKTDQILTSDSTADLPDGELPIRYTSASLKDNSGNTIGAIEYLVDITDEMKVIDLAEMISLGDYSVEVEKRSEEDRLGPALNRMTKTLRQVTEEDEKQNWFKTGQAELNDRMRGEKEIPTLCGDIISFFARYLDAQVAAIYVRGDDHNLTLAGSYALKQNENRQKDFKFGEGLIGQAAVDGKSRILTELPENYIKITSGLAEMVPRNILLVPVKYEGEVNGIIELGSINEFSDRQLDFLNQVSEHIGIAINSAQFLQQMRGGD